MKRVCVFQKYCFKVKVLKTFKFSSDRSCRSLRRRAISKSPELPFRRTYVLSVSFKTKPGVFLCYDKKQLSFCSNLAEMLKEATIHLCLFDESHFSNICTL